MSCEEKQVLAAGSGPILYALAAAWYKSGLSGLTVYPTDANPAERGQLDSLVSYTRSLDSASPLEILSPPSSSQPDWRVITAPFPFILYASGRRDQGEPNERRELHMLQELKELQLVCLEQKKHMLPVLFIRGKGLAGPLLHSDGSGSWEPAWRSIHSAVFTGENAEEASTGIVAALLANLAVQVWSGTMAGGGECALRNQVFILNPSTWEGNWHDIPPSPLMSKLPSVQRLKDIRSLLQSELEASAVDREDWFTFFEGITSPQTGIFHVWEERDLIQLPLSQCLVQPVDPLSEGPAQLLPQLVCSGLTHEEARREAGLAGLEAYAARLLPALTPSPVFHSGGTSLHSRIRLMADQDQAGHSAALERLYIGAGELAGGIARGLTACLANNWGDCPLPPDQTAPTAIPADKIRIEDVPCNYYLQALRAGGREPLLILGETPTGFPVIQVYAAGLWYNSTGLNVTLTLRQALKKALQGQDGVMGPAAIKNEASNSPPLHAPSCDPPQQAAWVLSAMNLLERHGWHLEVLDLQDEVSLSDSPFGIYGVTLLRKEEAV